MRENLDGHTAAQLRIVRCAHAKPSQLDRIPSIRSIDDRTVGVLMLDVDCLACDTCRIRSIGDRAKSFSACSSIRVLYPARVSSIICVSAVKTWKGAVTVSTVVLAPIRLASEMPCWTALPARSEPSVGISTLVYMTVSFVLALRRRPSTDAA